jgi:hypothetical protein
MNEVKEAKTYIESLRDDDTVFWDEKEEAMLPLPGNYTKEQLKEAFLNFRRESADLTQLLVTAIEKQQSQIEWLDRALKGHRHQLETGVFSSKPEI